MSVDCENGFSGQFFRENLLFTNLDPCGPSILQASQYRRAGDVKDINLLPELDVLSWLRQLLRDLGKSHFRQRLNLSYPIVL